MDDLSKQDLVLELIPVPAIQARILVVRDRQVMLDEDLADLYGVETRRLIEQVKRETRRARAVRHTQSSASTTSSLVRSSKPFGS
jgi:ORF6N domain